MKKRSGINLLPKSPLHSILLLIVLLSEAAFMMFLMMLDVLPGVFTTAILIVLIVIAVLIAKLLNCRKIVTKQRIIGVILSVLLIIGLCIGSNYIYSTFSMFNKISKERTQTEDYHVVVLEKGSYGSISDIRGNTLYSTPNESESYREAKGRLASKTDVKYKETKGPKDAGYKLVDAKGDEHDNIIFINNTNYEMLCEDIENFKNQTKILFTVSIDIKKNDIAKRINVTKDSFNIYISGIDTYGSIDKVSRSDVNMVMTVNPQAKKILLTSIPRDMYVTLHSYGKKDKLTHSGIYGIDETVKTVEDWLGININYHIRVNFTTVVRIIDIMDGINVESAYDFKAGGHVFNEGMNHLDGEAALAFSRERYSLDGGDNERVRNQQRVVKAIIQRITESPVILTKYTQILDAIGSDMQTNLGNKDISKLVKMQIADMGEWNIEMISAKGKGTYSSTFSMGSQQLYVAIPNEDSVNEVKAEIDKTMFAEY